jgi:DNA invertase Pin-like site-specific DNA recombinase
MPPSTPAIAYSYIRFSTPEQLKGDSLRRQTQATAEWCERNKVALDTSLSLRDLGVSAFKGVHRTGDKHALGAFLKLANQGRIPRGSYLVIENLDRLSREDERTALRLWMDILDTGINIVQLTPETVFRHEKSDMMDIMRAIIELSRGHSESRMKSQRNGDAWEEKRGQVRSGGGILTHHLPAWVREVDGTLQLDARKAAAVRRIFELAADGRGVHLIIKTLDAESRPSIGPSGRWSRGYVGQILRDRRAVGEFQPRHASGKPAGDPIPDYFPPCVTENEWLAARAAMGARTMPRGRVGEHVNVFSDLLHNARDGDRYYVGTRSPRGKRHRVLIARGAYDHGAACVSFPFDVFERAVLSLLREVDPHEVLGDAPGQDEVIVLSGELAHVQAQQAAIEAELLKGDVATLAKAARALDQRAKELTEQLSAAKQRAAHPAGEAWGEAMSLAAVIETARDPQEARLKLRSLLRRLVSEIWVLAVPRGRDRLAAVQAFFEGDGHRDYLILSRPPKAGRCGWRVEGGWWAKSLADVAALGPLDLRKRKDAQKLEQALAALDLDAAAGS